MYEASNEVVEVKEEAELLRLQMEVAQQEEEAARAALAAAQAALAAALAAPDESADTPEPQALSCPAAFRIQVPFMPLKRKWSCTITADKHPLCKGWEGQSSKALVAHAGAEDDRLRGRTLEETL